MKRIWNIFASTELTIILAVLVCVDAAIGSVLTVKYPQFYRSLDQMILVPALASFGTKWLAFTAWIYILVILVAVFSVNTAVCTADRLYKILSKGMPLRSLAPHIVHIGFLIAVVGHLISSVSGFKSPYNPIIAGEVRPVAERPGMSVRLDDVDVRRDALGNMTALKTTLTLFKDGIEAFTGAASINSPLIFDGVAFYHLKEGRTTTGLMIDVDGAQMRVALGGAFKGPGGESFTLGDYYPDFSLNARGEPYSRSSKPVNPRQEIVGPGGKRAFLDISSPGSGVLIGNTEIRLVNYITHPYAIIAINRDPGIWFIIVGSSILLLGMVLVFILRGGSSEIVGERGKRAPVSSH